MLRAFRDGTIFGQPYGEGAVRVVWLHGWARSGADVAEAAIDVARHSVASLALDLPGFGSSPAPAAPGGARAYAAMVSPVLAEVSDEPLFVVGHSFGGTVAAVLAAEEPARVRGLVLTGAPLLRRPQGAPPPRAYRVLRALHARKLVSAARLEAARQRYGSPDYRRASGVMREVLVASVNESYEQELTRLHTPTTFLWGEGDREVPTSVAERAMALVPAPTRLRVLGGVGHLVPSEAPHELAAVVLEALS